MKFLLLPVLMAFIAGAQVWCQEIDPQEESEYWTGYRNQIQDGWLFNNPVRQILLRMTRKPRPHQFIGLMGKRSMANAQITHKKTGPWFEDFQKIFKDPEPIRTGHRVNSFVGLMGRRSQEDPESYEWSGTRTYDQRR